MNAEVLRHNFTTHSSTGIYESILSYVYVIYKPWLRGVLHLYIPQLRSQRKFTVDKCRGEAEAFINSKLPMTEEEGCI